jgi:hypothetical protein
MSVPHQAAVPRLAEIIIEEVDADKLASPSEFCRSDESPSVVAFANQDSVAIGCFRITLSNVYER